MAIYHFHVKTITRSKGKSAVASAAYRHAAKMFDERENRTWNYLKKDYVIHKEILVPENAPLWTNQFLENGSDEASELLWNLVERHEKRHDSQLAREAEFALPIELTKEQSITLAREFIKDQFVLRGMIADWCVHYDEGNPHVHVMLTMRSLDENGFGLKVRAWNDKGLLEVWREKWAEYANFHLKLHQHSTRIDHRSYKDQGIDLIPTTHLGKAVTDMDRRGISTDIMKEANDVRRENLKHISKQPSVLLNKITKQSETFTREQLGHELGRYINDQGKFSHKEKKSYISLDPENIINEIHSLNVLTPDAIAQILKTIEHHESVFTEKHLAKAVFTYTDNAHEFATALFQVKASPELLYVGIGEDGRDRFSTRTMFDIENKLQKTADLMRKSTHVKISKNRIHKVLEKYQRHTDKTLTNEQLTAVKHILKPTAISCIVGRAGTGKSFSLGAARAVWEAQGLRVQGIALSGIAADGLSKDAGIVSRTIQSFHYAIKHGQIVLNHHDVIVMDEAGMTDSVSMMEVLKAVRHARAKLVLVGDHAQIQPVGPGATFRALIERLGFAEIQIVYRQKEKWQREATVAFSSGRVRKALDGYGENKCIHLKESEQDAMNRLVQDWVESRKHSSKNLDQYLVIAHRNKDVSVLNELLRAERIKRNEITDGYTVNGKFGEMKISQGDRLIFLKNDNRLGVKNGRFATIKSIQFTESGKVTGFSVVLDGTNKELHINPREYNDFAYGYSATVHKVQGMTVDHSFVYGEGYFWNRNLIYVAMSRHRESCHLYTKDQTISSLILRMSRLGMKDSLLDFPLAFAERRGFDVAVILKKLPEHLTKHIKILKEKIVGKINQICDLKNSEIISPKKINVDDVLSKYIEMEFEQTNLVSQLRNAKLTDPKSAPILSKKVLDHSKSIKTFAEEMIEHTEIKSQLDNLKLIKTISLAKCGGFAELKNRLKQNSLTQEDYAVLFKQLFKAIIARSESRERIRTR